MQFKMPLIRDTFAVTIAQFNLISHVNIDHLLTSLTPLHL